MNTKIRLLSAAALTLMVAACGTDPQERVSGGAAAGAATGAGVGALGGPVGVLAGAAIGGGAGAVTAATTSPSDVNLGRPVWDRPDTRVPGVTNNRGSWRSFGSARQAQQALRDRGFNPGPVDGVWGPQSMRATADFQRANGMEGTGHMNSQTLAALNVTVPSSEMASAEPAANPAPRRSYRRMAQAQQRQPAQPMPGMQPQSPAQTGPVSTGSTAGGGGGVQGGGGTLRGSESAPITNAPGAPASPGGAASGMRGPNN